MRVRNANAFTKLRLLMWKNFLQQWRHRWQSVIELVLPVLTLSLVLILRSQVEPEMRDTTRFQPFRAYNLRNSTLILGAMIELNGYDEISLAYSPESPVLDDVLRTAIANLLIQNIDELLEVASEFYPDLLPIIDDLPNLDVALLKDVIKNLVLLRAYNSSEELQGLYINEETTYSVLAGVQFDDALKGETVLPSKMSYEIRFPERPRQNQLFRLSSNTWRTGSVFPAFETPGPRSRSSTGGSDPGYVPEMFIALQQAISTAIISKITGEELDVEGFDVNLQRYPHPPHLQDLAVEAMQLLMPTFVMLSFSYTVVNIVRAITVEKENQLKETMKIMGVPTWLHWTAWFCKQFIYFLFASIFIVIILKMNWFQNNEGFGDYAVLTYTSWSVLFFFLMLYLTCTIFFAFMISGFFARAGSAALFTGVIWFLTYLPAFMMLLNENVSPAFQGFTCLFINSALGYGLQLMLAKESSGGMQWGDFFYAPSTEESQFLYGHVILMLVFDCILYMLIALYLEQVNPGPYGLPRPWYFPFQKSFWCPNSQMDFAPITFSQDETNSVILEPDPTDLSIGVKIKNLTKVFGANVAVNHLNLNIYDDQITVLLGHNGAGKSTTISMLTGNLKMTGGSVTLAGYDIAEQTSIARSHIGLCPQHNVLFDELTVKEHLEFFARLKGFTGNELKQEVNHTISQLELEEKTNYPSKGLSGGQKRRLCVGMAMCGGSHVVLLDEPTSGMDPSSRRALWDLLQKEKKGRCIILTTHFMDEADILGDRVGIMAHGRLQCIGSPYFLKRHYGVGYTLVVVKNDGFQLDLCNQLIVKHIPEITVKEDRGTEVTYSLSNEMSHKFETLLEELENKVDKINFKNYGLVATTLEDVFMSVGSDLGYVNPFTSNSSDDGVTVTTDGSSEDILKFDALDTLNEEDEESIKGTRLWWQRMRALWTKLFLVWIHSPLLILLQVLTPILIMVATLGVLEYLMAYIENAGARPLTLAVGYKSTETYLNYNGTSADSTGARAKAAYEAIFRDAEVDYMELTVIENETLDQYYLDQGSEVEQMAEMRHRVAIGATFSEDSVTAWFSNFGYHDIAISLAAVHSAILKSFKPEAELHVTNHPLDAFYSDTTNMQVLMGMVAMQLAQGIGNCLGIVSAVFVMFYIKERNSGAKLLQLAAGMEPLWLWISAAIFDWVWFIILCISIPISCVIFGVIGLSTFVEMCRMYLCLMVYGAAMLPLHYLCSKLFKKPEIGFVVMFFVNVLFGMLGTSIVDALFSPTLNTQDVANILDNILQFFPLYSLVTCIRQLNLIGLTTYSCLTTCDQLLNVLPNITECSIDVMCQMQSNCCIRENAYFEWEEPGILRYIFCMSFSSLVFWLLLLIIDYRILEQLFIRKRSAPPLDESVVDSDVLDEATHVQHLGKNHLEGIVLVAKDLTKYYGKKLAVNKVSFTVNEGECFGLLGVNGAGKTTTFKMLMGDESVSSGDAFIRGESVKSNITKIYKHIGYCPQFDAVFNELTGRQNIRLYALLRGLSPLAADARAISLSTQLGFRAHLDKRVEQYSGGSKRKLSTAIALLGSTRLVFVDEPTTGVDPAAKRQVWRALRASTRRAAQTPARALVLTSHSMEECEALCSRLTIMVNGQFQCFGTPQHLKNKFSQGFTLSIKMKSDDRVDTASREIATEAIKEYVNTNFKTPNLMEEYQGMLTYYLPDKTLPWSRMFGIMERAKLHLAIEDYSISQTTLEQIFLQFTKYQVQERDRS